MLRVAALAVGLLATVPRSQEVSSPSTQARAYAQPRVTFGVGERLEYVIKAGPMRGSAEMEVLSLDTVRGRPAWHARFGVRGGFLLLKVNDRWDSWIDTATISSLRFAVDIHDAGYERRRRYEFYPEKRLYFEGGIDTAVKTVDRPVDEASILYMIRTLPLSVGLDTALNNYFIVDRNPIRIRVLRRERIKIEAGEFDAIVIQPQIKTDKGMLAEASDARVWLSDDDRHIILQMKSRIPKSPVTLTLELKSYRPPTSRSPSKP